MASSTFSVDSTRFTVGVLLAGTILSATDGGAQTFQAQFVQAAVSTGQTFPMAAPVSFGSCGTTSYTQIYASTACGPGYDGQSGWRASSAASIRGGQLRAAASGAANLAITGTVQATASGGFEDRLTFVGLSLPATVWFWMRFDGLTQVLGLGSAGATAQVRVGNTTAGEISISDRTSFAKRFLSTGFAEVVPQTNASFPSLYRYAAPLSGRTFQLALSLSASVTVGQNCDLCRIVGEVNSDFSSTFEVAGIEVFDAAGADITGEMTLNSASGASYSLGAPRTTVPEPSTFVLCGLGFAVVVLSKRSRKALATVV